MDYDAFGPPAMSFALLGQAWWQWDGEGHQFDADGGTIWVVVHDGLDPAALDLRFPTREDAQCDHRFVELDATRRYLDTNIRELEGDETFADLVERLRDIRGRVEETFGTPGGTP